MLGELQKPGTGAEDVYPKPGKPTPCEGDANNTTVTGLWQPAPVLRFHGSPLASISRSSTAPGSKISLVTWLAVYALIFLFLWTFHHYFKSFLQVYTNPLVYTYSFFDY